VCNTFSERQVTGWLEDLNQTQRRDERILFGAAITTWILAVVCYAGVAYYGLHGKAAATAACLGLGSAILGGGIALFRKAKKMRFRRRHRNRQTDQQRRQQPPAAAA